ncbi:hypothetical protein SAMN05421841_1788 [Chryseobacterium wanjuense]|uniref:Uncharacterized protein n=1 Tax=Chryseobacterium wanjuense TaxID=356305 RepID=A0A1I0QBG4_9FLAO|nr:hypothetical protein [Chryseobacterium wanjuense]SEW24235.1 hypothetical protein SAMN05421841_1788 [Chryseobacterium wanjuense]
MSLEILNSKGSIGLSGSKLLSENDIQNGLLNKQNFFKTKEKTFDQISAFKDSPFGQYWEKRLPAFAVSDYGPSRVLNESNFSIIDLSKKLSSALASLYNNSIEENWDDIKFVVYANPDGQEVLKQYANPDFKPEDNQVMFLIETDDGKFDFGKIVRVKLGEKAIEKLRFKYPFLGQTDEDHLAEEFLNRSFEIKTDSSLAFSEAEKERKLNAVELKNLLAKAIQYDYKKKKFDDMLLFLILLQGEEFLGLNTPKKLLEISQWMRTKKYNEEKYWNALLEKDFTPAFLPDIIAPQNRKSIKETIKNEFKQHIDNISKPDKNDAAIDKIFKEILGNVLLYLFDKFSSLLDEGLKILDDLLPEGEMLNEIYNLNAFLVGLWNGCIEFAAGIVDLVSLIMIIARDGIGFALTDALGEAFEELLNEIVYNFEDFIKKLWEKFRIAIKEIPNWYLKYGSNQYYRYKELGELMPDIITLLVPALKAGKASKVAEEISLLKNLSKAEKELALEKQTQKYLEGYYETLRKESDDFSKKLEAKTAESEVKESFDNAEKEIDKKLSKQEIEEDPRKILDEKIKERKKFRSTNLNIQRIESHLKYARKSFQRERAGLDFRKVRHEWYYGKLSNRIKKVEISLEEVKILAKLKSGKARFTNIANAELEIWFEGKLLFSKHDYWASASKKDLMNNGKGIERTLEPIQKEMFEDSALDPSRSRIDDSEVKITSLMDEDIAKIATEHNIDLNKLEIKIRILTTYDPCNVCKREILSRAIVYPKSEIKVVRPMYKNNKNIIEPVTNNETFVLFLKQNGIKI